MGMVVRTNTMALNANRQLSVNNSAVAKSLEKLASGYRINRRETMHPALPSARR